MRHPGARAQFLATIELVLQLMDRHVACVVHFPMAEVPFVRVPGISTLEAVGQPDGSYEIWSTGDAPPDAVPLRLGQSLAETVLMLSQHEGRA
jgi:hypothetical protein